MTHSILSNNLLKGAAALACGLLLHAAHAEKADLDKPTNVEADKMAYDEAKQTNTFTGNVVLTRGTLLMKAEKIVVHQDEAGFQYATLYAKPGGVTSFRQRRDAGKNGKNDKELWIEGHAADRIEYDTKTEVARLYLRSKVKMLEGDRTTDEVEGDFISYDSRAELYTVNNSASGDGKPGSGRIRAVIQPRASERGGDGK